jgi:hypothetical protein
MKKRKGYPLQSLAQPHRKKRAINVDTFKVETLFVKTREITTSFLSTT